VLTERPVSPKEPARARPPKKGCGNKRTQKALLITYDLMKHWMKSSAKVRKEMETGKQSGLAFPAGPCRAGDARPQKHTETKQQSFEMLQIVCVSSFLDERVGRLLGRLSRALVRVG
jgi:hypothetical protein